MVSKNAAGVSETNAATSEANALTYSTSISHVLTFEGDWDATTGAPPTPAGDPNENSHVYLITVEGTINSILYLVGDMIIWDTIKDLWFKGGNGEVEEAPDNGDSYVRKNKDWVVIDPVTTLVETVVLTSQTNVTIELPVGFIKFEIDFIDVVNTTDTLVSLKTMTDATTLNTTDYRFAQRMIHSNSDFEELRTETGYGYIALTNVLCAVTGGKLSITDPRSTSPTMLLWQIATRNSGSVSSITGSATRSVGSDPVTHINIKVGSGTFDGGSIRVLGIK